MDDVQKRAKVGGEFGVNGDWYKGGSFIATTEAPKSSPVYWESKEHADMREANALAQAKHIAWLDGRRAVNASAISALLAHGSPDDTYEGFYPSLGRQLSEVGSLTPRQAAFAAKGIFGRLTKKNDADHCGFIDSAVIEYQA